MCSDTIITHSPLLESVLRSAKMIAKTDASVLITGESGTGKDLVARLIHQHSQRQHKTFMSVNCAALPDTLAESLVFGHRKGAFTGANTDHLGIIGAAEHGTLFLDEVAELSLNLQAKLLRFLESGEVIPLGATQIQHADVRILAATHRDLAAAVSAGTFRQDLFYRLYVIPVELPPLRERREDIKVLTQYFLKQFSQHYQLAPVQLSASAYRVLRKHPWQGNVRELRNVCERLSILLHGQHLEAENIASLLNKQPTFTKTTTGSTPFQLPDKGVNLDALEEDLLKQALDRTQNNKSHASRLLGISRDALNYRLRKMNKTV